MTWDPMPSDVAQLVSESGGYWDGAGGAQATDWLGRSTQLIPASISLKCTPLAHYLSSFGSELTDANLSWFASCLFY